MARKATVKESSMIAFDPIVASHVAQLKRFADTYNEEAIQGYRLSLENWGKNAPRRVALGLQPDPLPSVPLLMHVDETLAMDNFLKWHEASRALGLSGQEGKTPELPSAVTYAPYVPPRPVIEEPVEKPKGRVGAKVSPTKYSAVEGDNSPAGTKDKAPDGVDVEKRVTPFGSWWEAVGA